MERVIIIVMDLVAETIPSCEGGTYSTFFMFKSVQIQSDTKKKYIYSVLSIILIEFRI